MTTVYVITEGDYSDYGIICLFKEKKDAQQFIQSYNSKSAYTTADIEEWDLYEGPVVMIPWYTLFVDLQKENAGYLAIPDEPHSQQRVRYEVGKPFPRTKAEIHVGGPRQKPWRMTVAGPDPDKVLKVARDRVAKIKAEEAGL